MRPKPARRSRVRLERANSRGPSTRRQPFPTCPWRGTKVPLSRDFYAAARSWQHRDITSAGLYNRTRVPAYKGKSCLRAVIKSRRGTCSGHLPTRAMIAPGVQLSAFIGLATSDPRRSAFQVSLSSFGLSLADRYDSRRTDGGGWTKPILAEFRLGTRRRAATPNHRRSAQRRRLSRLSSALLGPAEREARGRRRAGPRGAGRPATTHQGW